VWQQIARNVKPPMFNGTNEAWPNFKWEFEQYLRQIVNVGGKINDEVKLLLLEVCMPFNLQKELKLLRKIKGNSLTFDEVFQQWENRFGHWKSLHMRKRWQDVSLTNSGKINLSQWSEFETEFRTCAWDVRDTNP